MSVAEEYHKLKAQLEELSGKAKDESLDAIHKALETLKGLGHNYRLVEDANESTFIGNGKSAAARTGSRRTGIREEVLAIIKQHGSLGRAEIIERLDGKGNKSLEQSVSNALSALKKAGTIDSKGGAYTAK